MKTLEKPQMRPLYVGEQFKVLEVIGQVDAEMPLHYCTSEVVVTLQEGKAILTIDTERKELTPGLSVLLPEGKKHTLSIIEPMKALVVMAKNATIEFAS